MYCPQIIYFILSFNYRYIILYNRWSIEERTMNWTNEWILRHSFLFKNRKFAFTLIFANEILTQMILPFEIDTKFYTLFRYNHHFIDSCSHIAPLYINIVEKLEQSQRNSITNFERITRVWEARRIFRREISKPLCRFSIVSICSSSTYPWNNNFGKINRWIVVSIHTIFFFTVTEFIEIKVHASNIPHFVLDSRFLDTSMTSGSSGGGAGANEAQSCSKRDIRLLLYGTRQWMCQSMVQ